MKLLDIIEIMEPHFKEGKFDSVKFFREEKERISRETEGMTFKEFKAYLEKHKKWAKK